MKAFMDLTGRFPYKLSQGYEYIYVLYNFDANVILAAAIKNHQAKQITDAWSTLHKKLTKHGHETKHFILDSKVGATLKAALTKNDKTYKLTLPNIHKQNAAERAIHTFKNHLLA
eukprot:7483115-Ditylum_brightwellii.AAC.1